LRVSYLTAVAVSALAAAAAVAQAPQPQAKAQPGAPAGAQQGQAAPGGKAWVAPGTPGSPIKGELFHAQVLMSAHGFSPGVIDGKEGESFKLALNSFQESRGLPKTGKLDPRTRQALLQANRPSTVVVKLGPDDVRHQYVYPFPSDPEKQGEMKFLGYRNMLEKVAERYHTTPATVVALNGPDKMIGLGQTLRLPNVVPQSRDYGGVDGKGTTVMNALNVDPQQPQGDYVVVDKSEGVLKVYKGTAPAGADGEAKSGSGGNDKQAANAGGASGATGGSGQGQLVAAFPVTMGSSKYPLPIGRWKATTYAFLPPFKYQPAILNNPKTDKEVDLPPGPNGPVGVAWLDLTKEHYGIHGTNEPQTIGRAESSGCIRLANWDVVRLARMLKPGFTAIFQA
jgi:lipoprotein-anchoring transpeptidase ErfK/SrfK